MFIVYFLFSETINVNSRNVSCLQFPVEKFQTSNLMTEENAFCVKQAEKEIGR